MKKKKLKRIRTWVRRHRYVLMLIFLATLGVAGTLTWYSFATDRSVQEVNTATQHLKAEAETIAREAQIKKAQQAAEEKARQEVAAKEAAEQAKSGTTVASDSKLCNSSKTHADPTAIDVVVNKKHCIQPLGFEPSDLVDANGVLLSAKAMDAYKTMLAAAAAAGQPFYTTSSYRSYAGQVATYNYWVGISGQAGADTYSARPGYSEHQTGLAFDVAAGGCTLDCFGSTTQYQWLQQFAADYGFIQRYYKGYEAITGYKAEEWHYRYVGVTVAKDMQAKGIKTLEQYWNISGGDY